MSVVKRRIVETVEVVQEPRNGEFITMFDLAEFGSDCADEKMPGSVGILARCTPEGVLTRLAAVAELVTRDDDETDPGTQILDAKRPEEKKA